MEMKLWRHRNVSDNVHGIIRLTDFEHRIMNGPLFNRLHYVYQDSTVFFTWPAVRIQRFEHSLGCMHLAGQMFYNAISNADDDVLEEFAARMSEALKKLIKQPGFIDGFHGSSEKAPSKSAMDKVKRFINKSMSEGEASYSELEVSSFLIPARVPSKIRYTIMYLAQGVRLAGMLHDLGHPPFSHVCEHVLSTLYDDARAKDMEDNSAAKSLVDGVEAFLAGNSMSEVALHEAIGNRLSVLAMSNAVYANKVSSPTFAFAFASSLVAKAMLNDLDAFKDMHTLVCGIVDADRLDFVQRDSKASGVGADAMQYGRIIEGLRLMKTSDGHFVFAMPTKVLPTVEDFLRKRFSNYKTIVFHHRVVKSEELLESVLRRLARIYFKEHTDEGQDSQEHELASELYVLPHDVSGLWSPLSEGLRNEEDAVLAFSQWNDSWLLTMLREEYTRIKIDEPKIEDRNLLRRQLAELLYSEKSYQTVVKRSGDCLVFRNELHRLLDENRGELVAILKSCKGESPEKNDESDKGKENGADGIVDTLEKVVIANESVNVLREIDRNYVAFTTRKASTGEEVPKNFTEAFREMAIDSLKEVECDVADILVTKNHIKTGVGGNSTEAYFYSAGSDITPLRALSAVESVMERDRANLPAFFAYVLCKGGNPELCHSEGFFKALAKRVYAFIYECVLDAQRSIQ